MTTMQIVALCLGAYLGLGILSTYSLFMVTWDWDGHYFPDDDDLLSRLFFAGKFVFVVMTLSVFWPGVWVLNFVNMVPSEWQQYLGRFGASLLWCVLAALACLAVTRGWV